MESLSASAPSFVPGPVVTSPPPGVGGGGDGASLGGSSVGDASGLGFQRLALGLVAPSPSPMPASAGGGGGGSIMGGSAPSSSSVYGKDQQQQQQQQTQRPSSSSSSLPGNSSPDNNNNLQLLPDDPFAPSSQLPDDPFAATPDDLFGDGNNSGDIGHTHMGGFLNPAPAYDQYNTGPTEYSEHHPYSSEHHHNPYLHDDDSDTDSEEESAQYALPPCPDTYWAVWVGSLPPRTQPKHLFEAFSRYGAIINCVVKSQQSEAGVYSDLGFVNFWFEHEASYAASEMDGQWLSDDVDASQPVRTRPPQEKATPPALRPLWYEMCQREAAIESGLSQATEGVSAATEDGMPLLSADYYAAISNNAQLLGPNSWAAKAAQAAAFQPPSPAPPPPMPRDDEYGPDYLDDHGYFQAAINLTQHAPGYYCSSLRNPSETFSLCKQLFERKGPPPPSMRGMTFDEQVLSVVQTGVTTDKRTPFISLRGIPLQYARDALRVGFEDVMSSRSGNLHVVVVCGVGGVDDRTEKHKHASHTRKYSLQDYVGGELLRDDVLLDRCKICPPHVPLYTAGEDGERRYYGSFLVTCQS
ncbi:RRM domain-containing protein [Pycnococcus provasolii]